MRSIPSQFVSRHVSLYFLVSILAVIGCTEAGYNPASNRNYDRNAIDGDDGSYRNRRYETDGAVVVGRRDTGSQGDSASARPRSVNVDSRSTDRSVDPGTGASAAGGPMRQSLAFPTGDRRTSAVLLEAQVPEEVRVGHPYAYTLRVTNLTDTPLHNVRVRDMSADSEMAMERDAGADATGAARPAAQPAGDAAPGNEPPPRTGDGDTGAAARSDTVPRSDTARPEVAREVDATRGDRDRADRADRPASRATRAAAPTWNVGTLAPGESKTREFSATADEVGSLSNCLTVAYSPTLCVSVRVVKPELQVTKTAPQQALVCQEITYTYRVTNAGTGTARDARVEETLPEGLVTADGERKNLSLQIGNLGAGQSREVSVKLRATRTGEFAGRALARAADGLEARSNDVTTVVREPVIAVVVEAPEARYVGEPVDFKVTVKNTGDANAENTIVRLTATGVAERIPERQLGTIEAGKSKTFTITTRADRTANAVQLTTAAMATCARQASDSASVAIRTAPALQIECVDGADPIRVGANTTYTITVKNEGTGPDSNVTVKAALPAELQYVGTRDRNAGDVKVEGQTITFGPIKTLAPGATATWTIEATAVGAGDVRFGMELTSESLTKPAMETEPTRIVGDDNK